jgi:hypothetical protein
MKIIDKSSACLARKRVFQALENGEINERKETKEFT